MALSIANRSDGAVTASGSTFTCSVTRSTGEGLVFAFFWEYEYGAAPNVTSVVWDPTGDNQALTLVQQQDADSGKRFAVYQLKNPTSAKTADIVITCASTVISSAAYICDRIIDFDSTSWITGSAKRSESDPITNDLPNTVASATGELAVFYGFCRTDKINLAAGDVGDYFERSGTSSSRSVFRGTKTGAASVTATFGYSDVANFTNALIAVSIAPASGTTPVQQDLSASYTVTGSVWQDLAASYALDGAVQTDFAASYSIKTSAQQDLAVSYNIIGPAGVSLNVDPDHVLRNNTTSVWANTEFKLSFYRADTDAFVVNKTVTTNASGLLGVVSDAALTAGVAYDIKIKRTAAPADMGILTATAA